MKTKYPNLFGILAALMLVASFVVPVSLASPSAVQADPGICKWDTLREPGSLTGTEVVARNTDILDMVVGSDFNTMVVVVDENNPAYALSLGPINLFKWSNTKGLFWSGGKWLALTRHPQWLTGIVDRLARQVYQVAMAPDNPNFYAVTTDSIPVLSGPREVWVTTDGGSTWLFTNLAAFPLAPGETIRTIDISVDYGGKRDIVVGTTTGIGGGRLFCISSSGFAGWQVQNIPVLLFGAIDFFAVKFSPSYASDQSLAVVFAEAVTACAGDPGGTWYNVAFRDVAVNNIPVTGWMVQPVPALPGVEVRDPTWAIGSSPSLTVLNKVDLELPSDFSGQAASLRRAYISTDAWVGPAGVAPLPKLACARDGIFRIDDTTVYTLMDTSNIADKSIYSIAYFGTYASGKLLAGERMGYPCTASVPTWFTDSPTTCPVPCWYPALKPTTGAGCVVGCPSTKWGVGAAIVAWAPQGNLAYVATGSQAVISGRAWFFPLLAPPIGLDESAIGISRNNGETWNQISLIDTWITRFTDVAPSPDCKTIYVASSNELGITCCGFDSVWRTSFNGDVVSPLTPQPVGTVWERVFTHVTGPNCVVIPQTERAILRLVPYCADPTGEIIAWAVYDPTQLWVGTAAWSPDYGDYWAMLSPRHSVQDMAFESRTVLYFLSPGGLVQKMPYTGTAWSSVVPDVDTGMAYGAHTIAAYPEGKVMVGANALMNGAVMASSYSNNFNTDAPSFAVQLLSGNTRDGGAGNVHVAFDPNFKDNGTYYIGVDNAAGACTGSVYRNKPAAQIRWADTNMMARVNGAVGCPHPVGQFGIALAFTGEALYSAHTNCAAPGTPVTNPGVDRTIDDGTGKFGPLSGMPKPGIAWDHLDVGLPTAIPFVVFAAEPSSLKLCGCCTLDTDTTLYAIDTNATYSLIPAPFVGGPSGRGLIWAFTDCLAKRGPALVTADQYLIGCDPVSGRAGEVNLCWEQLCVADAYDIEIAKDKDFTIRVIDWVSEDNCGPTGIYLHPVDVQTPCVYFPAGGLSFGGSSIAGGYVALQGNLECGHTYYWRVKVRECATTQIIRSPWSEVRSFNIKAGTPVVSSYSGLQLLSPANGSMGIPVKSPSFSWAPLGEDTKYHFVLAKDSALTQVVKEADVTNTAYAFDGTLDYSTPYFWKVSCVDPACNASATFNFQTEAKPLDAQKAAPAPPPPVWVWVVIAIGTILVIVTLVLIFKTRRV